MVNARLRETARRAFFFVSPRHFDFLDCGAETSKCFECERETFRLLKFEPQIEGACTALSQLLGTGWNWKFDYNTLPYDILEKNNCFSGTKTDVAVGFVPFCGIKTIRRS